ncbi:DCL family protein [Ruegeria sp. HKCCD6119]|uniref:DCL family protein n=1 Tax=Ruegeria sp. HKCCD6119 TaxID=2683003 RepID=UPI0014912F29|nr:DCL family protein [Ruegeria sp. HKCCD6119]NOD84307.1 DUF3223 domain-containing protein [Ruegeria sp. HKCCD6119]
MVKPIELPNGKLWRTQKEALQHFKEMLGRYKNDQIVDRLEDHDDLVAILERYDLLELGGPSKVGPGIHHFERRLNRGEGYSSPGFWVVRIDGTETDFSCPKAIRGTPATAIEEYYAACRSAVGADLAAAKQRQFDHFSDADGKIACDVSGVLISFSQAQLRHADPQFGQIVEEFRQQQGWAKADLKERLTTAGDSQISTSFLDENDATAFRTFHHKKAVLHVVSKDPTHGAFLDQGRLVNRAVRLEP